MRSLLEVVDGEGRGRVGALGVRPLHVAIVALGVLIAALLPLGKPALVIAAAAGVLVVIPILANPRLGLYLTIAAIPLEEVGKLGKVLPFVNITVVKLFALLTLCAWLLHLVSRRIDFVWRPEAGLLLLYLVAGALSLVDAAEVGRGLQEMVIFASTALFFIMVFNLLRTKRQLVTALVVLSVVSAGTFAYAGIQRVVSGTEIAERVGWLEEGEAAAGVEISNIEAATVGTVRRSTGTTAHSNVLAANTAFLFSVLAGLMALTRRPVLRLLGLAGMVCCLVGAVVSLSRTGMLTYVIVVPLLLFAGLLRITPMRVVLVLVAAVLSIPFLPEGVSRILDPTNYFSTSSVSVSERLKLWQAAAAAFVDHPFNGMGIGNNRGIFDYYHNPWNPGLLTVHSSYLQILVETGLPGLLVLGYFFQRVIRLFLRARVLFARQHDRTGFVLATSLLISFVSFLLIGAIAFDFMRIGFKNMWLFIGCSVVLYHVAIERAHAAELRPGAPGEVSEPRPATHEGRRTHHV